MSEHIVKVLRAEFVNHNVRQFTVERPKGYEFISGQATDVSINLPDWKDELRPFTFTSLNDWDHLEFTIKIYNDHEGVTKQLGKVNAGVELILHDVFGVIQYKGPGVFIAGGAGVTPFISIFRHLKAKNEIGSNVLVCANKTKTDIILEKEFTDMLGDSFINILSGENEEGYHHGMISEDFLKGVIKGNDQQFYVCGPPPMMDAVLEQLANLGVGEHAITVEV
ncbi:MAG: FAD-binding oxidoreductase [Bacteroidia bacterium]